MASSFTVGTEADWNTAVTVIAGTGFTPFGTDYTLSLTTSVLNLASDPIALITPASGSVTIEGNGGTLDGGDTARGLFVHPAAFGGTVLAVQNITIADAAALGGNGGPGGGGGAGLGGGLFVASGATVVLNNVNFVNDQAVGGSGSAGVLGGGGGMGGNGGAGDTLTGAGGGGGGLGQQATGGNASMPGGNGILAAPFGAPFHYNTANPGADYGGGGGGIGAGNPGAHGGAGGFNGSTYGGGGGGANPSGGLFVSNYAGFGGGGGSGVNAAGGFGGGGGGAYGGKPAGAGGFGAGSGAATNPGGGGGLGAGGAIFVASGGALTITSGSITGGTVAGGNGGGGGTAGSGLGAAIFLNTTSTNFGTVTLAQPSLTLSPGSGKRVSIDGAIADDAGVALTGGGTSPGAAIMVTGAGTVELGAANTYAGGTTIGGGTLELGTAQSAGSGAITFGADPAALVIDGTQMPVNTIDKFGLGGTIDLAGIVANGSTANLDSNAVLSILTATGTVALQFDASTALAGGHFSLAPDGHGGTAITTDKAAVVDVVTITGASGGSFGVPFTNQSHAWEAQARASAFQSAIDQGQATQLVVDGTALPASPAGQQIVLYDPAGLAVTLPDSGPAAVFTNATGVATVTSGASNADLIVAGNGGINFTAGLGLFNLFAGDGSDTISLSPGVGGGLIYLGNGDATVNAIGGDNVIDEGSGNHVFTFGIGANNATAGGSNTILGGPGNITFHSQDAGHDLVLLGSGTNSYDLNNPLGAATIASGAGNDSVNVFNSAGLYYAGSGNDMYWGGGTVVGGSGSLDVFANSSAYGPEPDLLLFAGPGTTSLQLNPGAPTVVGHPAGSMNISNFDANLLLFAQGSTTVQGYGSLSYPPGSDTIVGVSGSLDLIHEAGLVLAGPAGNNMINVVGNSTVFGTAAGDVLTSSELSSYTQPYDGSATDVLVGGAGAETISGAGSTANNVFFAGSGPEFLQAGDWITSILAGSGADTVASGVGISLTGFVDGRHSTVTMMGFDPAKDYLTLIGFGTGELASALAGAQTVAGSEVLTLSDGTHITFAGYTGVSQANFL